MAYIKRTAVSVLVYTLGSSVDALIPLSQRDLSAKRHVYWWPDGVFFQRRTRRRANLCGGLDRSHQKTANILDKMPKNVQGKAKLPTTKQLYGLCCDAGGNRFGAHMAQVLVTGSPLMTGPAWRIGPRFAGAAGYRGGARQYCRGCGFATEAIPIVADFRQQTRGELR